MRGTGAVTIGTGVVYAYFTVEGRAARLRLSADDCEQFDLFEGQQVRVGLPEREAKVALVTGVVPASPYVWVELEFAGWVSQAG